MRPARPPLVDEVSPRRAPPSLREIAAAEREIVDSRALKSGVLQLGQPPAKSEEEKRGVQEEAARQLAEREERRRSVEEIERRASEEAAATAAALIDKYRIR